MLPEPWDSVAKVLVGALLCAWAAGSWCGCLGRWRWRKQWRAIMERQERDLEPVASRYGTGTTGQPVGDDREVSRTSRSATGFFLLDWRARRHAERERRLREVAR